MGIRDLKAHILSLLVLSFWLISSVAQAELALTINPHFTHKNLQSFVFKKNQEKFSLRKEAVWLKKNFKSKADHAYILNEYRKVKYSFRPILFFYKDHLELRVNGRLLAKISDIDSLNRTLKINKQDVTFKPGQNLAQLHHRLIIAMNTRISWTPLDLIIPKAHAFSMIGAVALFYMVRASQQAQNQTHEGATVNAAEKFCSDPGSTVRGITRDAQVMITRVYNFSKDTDGQRDVCVQGNTRVTYSHCDCIGRAYIQKYGYDLAQTARATQLCGAGISARNQCEARQRQRQRGQQSPQNEAADSSNSTSRM